MPKAKASDVEDVASPFFDTSSYAVIKDRKAMQETFKVKKDLALQIREAVANLKVPDNYSTVRDEKGMRRIASLVQNDGRLIFDLETLGTNPWRNRILCASIWAGGEAFVIPFEHRLMECADPALFIKIFGPLFKHPEIELVNHNVKFDLHFVEEQFKIPVGRIHCDTMLQAWLIDPTSDHGLKELCGVYGLDRTSGNYTSQFGKIAWSYLEPKLAAYYACHDAELVDKLLKKQNAILDGKPKMKKLFWDVEMGVLNESYEVERQGLLVDEEYISKVLRPTVYKDYAAAVKPLEPYIKPHLQYVGVNTVVEVLESPSKLGKVFFERLGIPEIKGVTLKWDNKRQMDVRTLDKNAIAALKGKYEAMKLLGDYRKVATVKKMFVDKLPELIVDGRIHPTINVIGTETGRMSMNNPNLQQIPSRMGPLVRQMFVPERGHVLVSADFSQQEMRLMAHYSRDSGLIRIFDNDLDLYTETAIEVFDLERGAKLEKSDPHRHQSKILILGLGYGMGPDKYAQSVGVTKDEGRRQHRKYHEKFPGVKKYQERASGFAKQNGYIVTMLGRERRLPFINAVDKKLSSKAERAAGNTPIQGSAADMTKKATIEVARLIRENNWPVRIWLWVHDEIIYEVDTKWAKEHPEGIDEIVRVMESALPLCVPMKSSATFEDRWGIEVDEDELDDDILDELEDLEAA